MNDCLLCQALNSIIPGFFDKIQVMNLSVWGQDDKETLHFLREMEIKGKWLNLGAGDGRYNDILLEKAGGVIAGDIDKNALKKLRDNTLLNLKSKLEIKVFNILDKFPFKKNQFDGVFCTGTLHLFPESQLKQIFKEISRCLKLNGLLVFDFATDRKKIYLTGKPSHETKVDYKITTAEKIIKNLLPNYKLSIIKSKVPEELVIIGKTKYLFSCDFLLIKANKIK